jgi:hypothetical protein
MPLQLVTTHKSKTVTLKEPQKRLILAPGPPRIKHVSIPGRFWFSVLKCHLKQASLRIPKLNSYLNVTQNHYSYLNSASSISGATILHSPTAMKLGHQHRLSHMSKIYLGMLRRSHCLVFPSVLVNQISRSFSTPSKNWTPPLPSDSAIPRQQQATLLRDCRPVVRNERKMRKIGATGRLRMPVVVVKLPTDFVKDNIYEWLFM